MVLLLGGRGNETACDIVPSRGNCGLLEVESEVNLCD
jgi:hypothetical protein